MTKFGTVTVVGRSTLGASNAPILRGGAAASRKFLGPSTCTHTYRKQQPKFAYGDETRCEEKILRVDRECWRAICLQYILLVLHSMCYADKNHAFHTQLIVSRDHYQQDYRSFLPRDRVYKSAGFRPVSVRLSVTSVDCIQTAEDIVKLSVRP